MISVRNLKVKLNNELITVKLVAIRDPSLQSINLNQVIVSLQCPIKKT